MAELDQAISQIRNMLSSPDGQRQLENLVGTLTGNNSSPPQAQNNTPSLPAPPTTNEAGNILSGLLSGSSSSPINAESLMKIKNIMDGLQMDNDPRVNLLSALRPYISSTRGQHIDHAIRLMSISKLPTLLKNFTR